MKCAACGANVSFVVNADTGKQVPLVPFDEKFPKAIRYRTEGRQDGWGNRTLVCIRDNAGPLMSHFANCAEPGRFSGKSKAKSSGG